MSAGQMTRCFILLGLSACSGACFAQSTTSFKYFYDDSGELFRVLDSSGNLIEYDYDAVGNILQIKRSTVTASALAIFNITPLRGAAGTVLTIYGQGFSALTAGDIVKINGVLATVLSATDTELVVLVPTGVASGQLTVTVNGVTVSSGTNLIFTPTPIPVINSLTPDGAIAGTVLPVAVSGSNMIGATFGFPAGATASALNVDAALATLQVTALSNRGVFPLVATTAAGSSTGTVTAGNHFIVMISPDQATSQTISVLNTADPVVQGGDPSNVTDQAISAIVSVLNTADPVVQGGDPSNVTDQANSAIVSVLNTADPTSQGQDPTDISNQATSNLVSVLNESPTLSPEGDPTNVTDEADSYIVSVNNSTTPALKRSGAFFLGTSIGIATNTPLNISNPAGAGTLVAGQLLSLGVDAPFNTDHVDLAANGMTIEQSWKIPYLFSFNAPADLQQLDMAVNAMNADEVNLGAINWLEAIEPDLGTRVHGKVVDAAGTPIGGLKVNVEATGVFAEYFKVDPTFGNLDEARSNQAYRKRLESGLNWVNPKGVFGPDPVGTGLSSYLARYKATLLIPEDGVYAFRVNTSGTARLQLDSSIINGSVQLTAGPHQLELNYLKASEPAELQLLWTPPSGLETALPAGSLIGADSSLSTISSSTGDFNIPNVPARVGQIRIQVEFPDGYIVESAWRSPLLGLVTELGMIVASQQHQIKEQK